MECYEQGILSRKDADGLDLTWGNHQAMVALCEKIVRREGLGEIFADGTRAAAQKIGRGAEQYAMHVGGQEIPMHDPRCTPGYATSYCADATPARHMQGGSAFLESGFFIPGIPFEPVEKYRYSGKSDLHRFMSNLSHVINASGMCYFSFMVYGADMIPPFLEFATGRPYPMEELQTIGERIGAMRMLFNIREGVSLSDWKIPGRMIGSPPLASGPLAGVTVDARTLISEYLKKTGWDTVTGKPSAEKLKELSLKDMA
jgi:aldehyde:ferredoxin oxidoreductase